jgi:hypothetical protein
MFGSLNHAGIKASSKLMGLEPRSGEFPSPVIYSKLQFTDHRSTNVLAENPIWR